MVYESDIMIIGLWLSFVDVKDSDLNYRGLADFVTLVSQNVYTDAYFYTINFNTFILDLYYITVL